jgi:hypothetical protein
MYRALQREHNIKHWIRNWKVARIEKENPEGDDLYFGISGGQTAHPSIVRTVSDPRVEPEGGTVVGKHIATYAVPPPGLTRGPFSPAHSQCRGPMSPAIGSSPRAA